VLEESRGNLEAKMQRLSLATSLIALGLMLSGFVVVIIHGTSLSIPGVVALSPPMIKAEMKIPLGLGLMSAGIVLLSLLPILRILLALSLYFRNRQVLNVMVALIVFIELLVSVRTGG
jgi:uncharacterized membrane protein